MFLEPDASAASQAPGIWTNQLDSRALQSGNQLHQRIDVTADDAVTCFHALNSWHRKIRQFGRLPLIYIQERAGGPELISGNHEFASSKATLNDYIYTIGTAASTINSNVQYIKRAPACSEGAVHSQNSRRKWKNAV